MVNWGSKNKKVLLIDGDSTIPNLALMQMATWFKKSNTVDFLKLGVSYYPHRQNKVRQVDTRDHDLTLCSVIFNGTKKCIDGKDIIFGGTGHDLTTTTPEFVKNCTPDYSLYPENKISYGFLSRGCSRKCTFCVVPQKEGKTRIAQTIDEVVQHKKVKFLDNNILSLPDHEVLLAELGRRKIKCQFMQGLDLRLLTERNAELLKNLNYFGDYIFAFDNWKYRNAMVRKIELMNWVKPWKLKFYVYVDPEMDLLDHLKRIDWLLEHQCLPYVMRDQTCWSSENKDFFTDLAAWCNQPNLIKTLTFPEFLKKRHKNHTDSTREPRVLKLFLNTMARW